MLDGECSETGGAVRVVRLSGESQSLSELPVLCAADLANVLRKHCSEDDLSNARVDLDEGEDR